MAVLQIKSVFLRLDHYGVVDDVPDLACTCCAWSASRRREVETGG